MGEGLTLSQTIANISPLWSAGLRFVLTGIKVQR
jgi:hypothetical protein